MTDGPSGRHVAMHRDMVPGLAATLLALLAVAALTVFLYSSAPDLVAGTLVATVVCLPGLGRLIRTMDPFDPLVLMTVLFAIAVPLSVVYVVARAESALYTAFGPVPLTVVNKAILASSLAMGGMVVGFYLVARLRGGARDRVGELRRLVVSDATVTRLVWLYWTSVVVRLWTIATGYGTFFSSAVRGDYALSNLLVMFTGLVNIAYPMSLFALLWNGSKGSARRALPLLIVQSTLGVLVGSKSAMLGAVIPYAYFYGYGSRSARRARWGVAALVVAALVATTVAFPIVERYRQVAGTPGLGGLLSALRTPDGKGSALDPLGRVSWVPSISRLMMVVPDYLPFEYGRSLWPALVWFVPRSVWLDKPVLSTGAWYAHTILGWDPSSRAEAAITLWGEAYLNFGVLGMVVSGLIMGMLSGLAYNRSYRYVGHPYNSILYYFFASTFILGFERNLAALIAAFGQSLIMSFVIWRIVTLGGSRRNKIPMGAINSAGDDH